MRSMSGVLLVVLAAAGVAHGQTFDHVEILVGGYEMRVDGGDKPAGVWHSTGPVTIGKLKTGTFSVADCAAFSASSDGSLHENATAAWRFEITPTGVVRDAVTFKLRWLRFLDNAKSMTIPTHDVQLTLRPGESWLLDSAPVPPGAKTHNRRPCNVTLASLRVSVEPHPMEWLERRLIHADLWLVEQVSNGPERSQMVSVRGLPNRAIPFYFDRITDGAVSLDIYGRLTARPGTGMFSVTVETRGRLGDKDTSERSTAPSEIQLKLNEIVEIRLPKLGEAAGPFAARDFSIRIRARQLR